jgi:outer membrane lipoprotein carrier protein
MDSEKFSRRPRHPETINGIAICGALFCAAAQAQVENDAPSAGIAALDGFLANIETLSAEFRQDVWTAENELIETSTGTMSLKRPNQFYWHFETAPEMIVVADGGTLWTYDVELAQVARSPLADITAATPAMLLSGDAEWRAHFDVVRTNRLDGRDWIELAPKAPGGDYKSVLIGFNGDLPEQIELVDGLEQVTRVVFSDIRVNPTLDASTFIFIPPGDVDVIGSAE